MSIKTGASHPSVSSQQPAKQASRGATERKPEVKGPARTDNVELKKDPQKATAGAESMSAGLANSFAPLARPGKGPAVDPGQKVVEEARTMLGRESASLKGELSNFQAAGGKTNNCADFVSSMLMNNGQLKGKQVNVDRLKEQLQKEGWSQVDADKALPGDVAFHNGRRHTELVSEAGGTKTIGSNNQDPVTRKPVAGKQWVTERPMDPSKGTFWHRPEPVQ